MRRILLGGSDAKKDPPGEPQNGEEDKDACDTGEEDSECNFLRTHYPSASELDAEKKKQAEQIKQENRLARGKSQRTRTLSHTQTGAYVGNSTARRIVLRLSAKEEAAAKAAAAAKQAAAKEAASAKQAAAKEAAAKEAASVKQAPAKLAVLKVPGGYDPFAVAAEESKKEMADYCATLPGYPMKEPDKHEYPLWYWWWTLLTEEEWLDDTHVSAWTRMMARRLETHPDWFKSDRIMFLDSRITQYWARDWPNFQACELLPAQSLDWYFGKLPRSN
ncbi:unnamed protein product [Microthlaspi erraticum]|uniref:Ubiquitin-like protease family profile domain-containing protein n=1 Tax=Microthlaspi erraticum TaxID=1685480 RepID=A0A6D2HWA8_9BRAS|nr:unnamed protein product [Microthlaspi erraticum]